MQSIREKAIHLGHTLEIGHPIKSGKEATVYRVTLDGSLVAMKLYKPPEERTFRNTNEYLLGKFYKNTSERKAINQKNAFGKKLLHANWIRREYFMLEKLFSLGASIPKPILHIESAIFMELLGDETVIAPRLCDMRFSEDNASSTLDTVLESMRIFWEFGIVHADLSEYNILFWKEKPYIIDFPQAINRKEHPNAEEMLMRDIRNVMKFFRKFTEGDEEKVVKDLLSR